MALPPGLVIAHPNSPGITIYDQEGDTFTKLADPASPPTWCREVAFSSDTVYMATAHDLSPYVTIHKRTGDVFDKLANPASLPAGSGTGVAFSPDVAYLAVAHNTSPYVTIYKRDTDTFTKLANPASLPTGGAKGVDFSPDGTYLAVAHATAPFLTIYKRSGDTFTKLADPATLPTNNANRARFSHDGAYLTVAHDASPYITIYSRSGDTFTKLADPATLPASNATGADFSNDGVYLAVAHHTTPYITIYSRSGDTFTKLANPATLPTGVGYDADFSTDGTHLAVSHATSPYVTIYKRSGDTFTKLADPAALPSGNGYGVAFLNALVNLLSGAITEAGVAVARTVRAYRRDTGALLGETVSSIVGTADVVATSDTQYVAATSRDQTIPAATEIDDLLLAFVMHRDTLTAPSGWTLVASQNETTSGVNQTLSIYSRTAVSGDAGATTTWTQATSQRMAVHIHTLRHSGGATLEVKSSAKDAQSVASSPYPAAVATSDADGNLGIAAISYSNALAEGNATTVDAPTGFALTTPGSVAENRLAVAWVRRNNSETTAGNFTVNVVGANHVAMTSVIVGAPSVADGTYSFSDLGGYTGEVYVIALDDDSSHNDMILDRLVVS